MKDRCKLTALIEDDISWSRGNKVNCFLFFYSPRLSWQSIVSLQYCVHTGDKLCRRWEDLNCCCFWYSTRQDFDGRRKNSLKYWSSSYLPHALLRLFLEIFHGVSALRALFEETHSTPFDWSRSCLDECKSINIKRKKEAGNSWHDITRLN